MTPGEGLYGLTTKVGLRLPALACLLLSIAFACAPAEDQRARAGETAGPNARAESSPEEAPSGMVWISGGQFTMGSEHPSAEQVERPSHKIEIDGFWMDETEVTNAQFRAFVEATGYLTLAERPVDWEEMKRQLPPGTPKPPNEALAPGSLVFTPPDHAVPLHDYSQWWSWTTGANWRQPRGPGSSIEGMDDYPAVHIAYDDAEAYARWAGKRLPTEAEWEFAARAGRPYTPFAWGDELRPGGRFLANFFQGSFPHHNTAIDGFAGAAPVKSFPPNAFGLYDMIGNVWEWTSDWYRPDTYARRAANQPLKNPRGPETSFDPREPLIPKRVIKGGSFLCSEEFCANYRPSARMASAFDSGQEHLGFRCVK
jgi:sulfatase modifying factor 1